MHAFFLLLFARLLYFDATCRLLSDILNALWTMRNPFSGTTNFTVGLGDPENEQMGFGDPGVTVNGISGVCSGTLSAGDYNGMWRLTLLCACVQVVGLFFIHLMPSGVVEQLRILRSSKESPAAGAFFLVVVFCSLMYVVIYTVLTIIDPDLTE